MRPRGAMAASLSSMAPVICSAEQSGGRVRGAERGAAGAHAARLYHRGVWLPVLCRLLAPLPPPTSPAPCSVFAHRRFTNKGGFMDGPGTLSLRDISAQPNVHVCVCVCVIWRCAGGVISFSTTPKSNLIWPTYSAARRLEEIVVVVYEVLRVRG